MRELSKANGKKVITTQVKNGQIVKISEELQTPVGDPYRKIEVEIYEEGVDGFKPYLLEFYSYDENDLKLLDQIIELDDWVTVKYQTSSKENRATQKTYTTSTLVSISKITKEELEKLNAL